MSPELEQLLSIQQFDLQLKSLEQKISRLIEREKDNDKKLESDRKTLEHHRAELQEMVLKRREGEQEVEALADEQRKFESRTIDVKTNEELRALRKEIDDVGGKRSALETSVLESMEKEDAERQRLADLEKKFADAESAHQGEREAIEAERKELAAQQREIEQKKDEILGKLRADLRNRYLRVRSSRRSDAVVPLTKQACGGCHTTQPPQRIQEVKAGDILVVCEFCGRLIVGGAD